MDSDLVGRDAELGRLRGALGPGHVVAVTGPPGVGKTALVRAALQGREGVVRVQLDDARTAKDLWAALGRALSIPLSRPERARGQIGRALRDAEVVVLDGIELLEAEAWEAFEELRRERDGISWILAGVSAPPVATAELQLAPLSPEDARRMLVLRATARSLGRPLDPDDPALPTLADRLDGLPLALELAAGRLALLTPAELVDRLDTAVVRGGDRRTSVEGALRFAWSLLGEADRKALVRLSLPRGFTLETAEALLGGDALGALERLRSRSAIVVREGRMYVLEGLRRIASERVDDDARGAFVDWWVRRCGELKDSLHGPRDTAVTRAVAGEQANLRMAFDLARAAGRPADALVVLQCLLLAVRVHGPLWTLDELPDPVPLAREAPSPTAVRVLCYHAAIAIQLGRIRRVREELAVALELCGSLGDDPVRSLVLAEQGVLSQIEGDLPAARDAFAEAVRTAPPGHLAALSRMRLATAHHLLGELHSAIEVLEDALGHVEGSTSRLMRGSIHVNLGLMLAELGREVEAQDMIRAATHELEGVDEMGRAVAIQNLGLLAVVVGDDEAAAAHLEAARELMEKVGSEVVLGMLTLLRGVERWAAGDRAAARELLTAAVERQREADPGSVANTRAWRAALEADSGRPEALDAELSAALEDGASPGLVEILRAFGGGAPPPVGEAEPLDVRIARRLLSKGRPALRCDRTGKWFERPGERVDLARRGALRRILAALVEARMDRPGTGLTVQQLFEAGWPGERAHPDAAAARVYTAVRELRSLGVGEVLRREAQGYLLDPSARIDVQP